MSTIVALPSNASKWQMGFNSAFKGLNHFLLLNQPICTESAIKKTVFKCFCDGIRFQNAAFFSAVRLSINPSFFSYLTLKQIILLIHVRKVFSPAHLAH
jgi:hypothetical protein